MKNIHLLPTDKPTGLFESQSGVLHYSIMNKVRTGLLKGYHIYITSDEKIKEGDWCIYHSGEIVQYLVKLNTDNLKKIILTTDQGLIADGVQSIDDEFLDWFVKNTSCEEVYILDDYEQVNQDNPITKGSTNVIHKYKIFIPQEEPKQETLEDAAERILEENYAYNDDSGDRVYYDTQVKQCIIEGAKWQAEQFFKDDVIQTLEKGIAILLKKQEKMYNEEEVYELLCSMPNFYKMSIPQQNEAIKEWFEQFKKHSI